MDAKKVAIIVAVVLTLILLADFSARLMWDVNIEQNANQTTDTSASKVANKAAILTIAQVEELLAWSDVKPTPEQIAQAQQAVVATPVVAPLEPVKPDVHEQVRNAIVGDVSKQLLGDQLLTLRGLFFDAEKFAVVEVENIVTNQKQYYRAKANELIDIHPLIEIGKNHILIQSGDQKIRLQMFEGTL